MPGRTEVEQLHKIFELCGSPSEEYWKRSKLSATIFKPQHPYKRTVVETFKDFPPSALALLDFLMAFEPEHRGTITSALHSEFFTTRHYLVILHLCRNTHLAKSLMSKCERQEDRGQQLERVVELNI